MKLLLTLDFLPVRGGIQRYLYDIVKYEYAAGDRVIVGSSLRGDPVDAALAPVPVQRCGWVLARMHSKLPLLALFFSSLISIRSRRPDLIEAGNIYAGIVAWLLYRVIGTPYGVYTYGGELLGARARSVKGRLLQRVLRDARTLYALGPFTAQLVRDIGIPTRPIIVPPHIPHPGPLTQRESASHRPFHILSVARLVPHKGIAVLINAIAYLHVQGRSVTCTIVGTGPQRESLRDQIRRDNLSTIVHCVGSRDDAELDTLYRTADCLVLPSLAHANAVEGFGIVLLEAMARGLPVVASACGGIPGALDNGKLGVLVPPGDSGALSAALAHSIDEPVVAATRARAAYDHVMRHHVRPQ